MGITEMQLKPHFADWLAASLVNRAMTMKLLPKTQQKRTRRCE